MSGNRQRKLYGNAIPIFKHDQEGVSSYAMEDYVIT